MKEQHQFFADDGTRARGDLRVDGNPSITHDPETEIVRLGSCRVEWVPTAGEYPIASANAVER